MRIIDGWITGLVNGKNFPIKVTVDLTKKGKLSLSMKGEYKLAEGEEYLTCRVGFYGQVKK